MTMYCHIRIIVNMNTVRIFNAVIDRHETLLFNNSVYIISLTCFSLVLDVLQMYYKFIYNV